MHIDKGDNPRGEGSPETVRRMVRLLARQGRIIKDQEAVLSEQDKLLADLEVLVATMEEHIAELRKKLGIAPVNFRSEYLYEKATEILRAREGAGHVSKARIGTVAKEMLLRLSIKADAARERIKAKLSMSDDSSPLT